MGRPWEILHGDVRRVCKTLEANSFDAVLCDPPYGLSFMGRRWDYSVPSALLWSEVERVLKPGAHAMIFGGSRTFHRTVVAAEDGGLIPRDLLFWIYGSGFPKSHDVSKAIDKDAGAEREVIGPGRRHNSYSKGSGATITHGTGVPPETAPATEEAEDWYGFGTALKPSYEPILLARKMLDGTVAENALKWGAGALAIDAARIGSAGGTAGRDYEKTGLFGMGGKATIEQLNAGRWPANIILSHLDACELVGHRPSSDVAVKTKSTGKVVSENVAMGGANYGPTVVGRSERPDEEIWTCAPGCPVRMLDEQSGDRPGMSGGGKHRAGYPGGMFGGIDSTHTARGDSGGASRFFYTAKADRYQREAGLEKKKAVPKGVGALRDGGRTASTSANTHPTVKPIDLIRYLAALILPPKRDTPRRILVPFSGVASEMIGCMQAGWDEVVGIEREAEYIEIAKARITGGGVLSGLMDRKLRRRKRERERVTVDASTDASRGTSRNAYGSFAHNDKGEDTEALREKWREQARKRR